jgi:lipopolysaccharide transport system permease protein
MARQYQQHFTSSKHLTKHDWRELWQRKELLAVLVRRDLQVRYKNTTLGVLWVILQPLLATVIFTLIFARLLKFGTNQDNYLVSTFIGFIFWQFFSGSLSQAATTIYEQISLVKKIYFPRLYLPLTVVLRAFFDFIVSAFLLVAVIFFTHSSFHFSGLLVFILVAGIFLIFTSGLSFIFAALNARYRDFRHLTPFILQLWFYATPVFYPASLLNNTPLAWLNFLNPIAQGLQLVRNAIFQNVISWSNYFSLLTVSVLVWCLGFWIFKKMETTIVDWT